ncbi:MAG: VirB3 family type IV secretion system protein [Neisseriaceae bacterium]
MARIDRSLYRPQLLGGIERLYAVILSVFLLIIIIYGALWSRVIGISSILTIWVIMAAANSKDYIFFKVLIRHLFQQDYYIAHTPEQKTKGKRKAFVFNPN